MDGTCDIHGVFFDGQEALLAHFASSSIADLAARHTAEELHAPAG
jgi:hypothetical protein